MATVKDKGALDIDVDAHQPHEIIPSGGLAEQLLAKASNEDYDLYWKTGSGGGGVTDHAELTGLDVDDHLQYHTDARGDVRYYSKAALDGGQLNSLYFTEAEIDALLADKSDVGHIHDDRYYTDAEVDTLLTGKSDTGHNHDAQYYTEGEVTAFLAGKSNIGHTHVAVDITDFNTAGDARWSLLAHSHAFASLTGIPTTIGGYGITDFNALGDARWSLLGHVHTFGSLTGIPTTIAGYGITDLNALGDARWSLLGHTHSGLAPAGGLAAQVLKKIDGADYNYSWQPDATGGGGGGPSGTAVLDFGATPAQETSVVVLEASVLSTSHIKAFWMGETSADNSADAHEQMAEHCRLVVGNIVAGVSFTIKALLTAGFATDEYNVRWECS